MQNPYMSQIINGTKNYEFRKYCLKPSVKRIWFYRTAPHSALTHICEILPARTRNPGDAPIEENGSGNAEFNNRHRDWAGYNSAYKIVSVYELRKPISLAAMRGEYGFKSAPRGLVYLPQSVAKRVAWRQQKLVLGNKNAYDNRGGDKDKKANRHGNGGDSAESCSWRLFHNIHIQPLCSV
ncbi:Putative protein of unknown function [Podospora comata]|uniref:ASCH domain-containing protein n=1 Tax=Podospora comata TaxID=48703 RepID=A0ABY6S8W1_PODCO|nr:Putative protein of unknown function [Podospora comata]